MSAPAGSSGQTSPNATVGSVHSRKPIGAIPAKPTAKQMKPAVNKAPAKPKRKR